MEGGITFQLLNSTPYIIIYIIYHDLKVKNGEIFCYNIGGGVNFNVEIWPHLYEGLYLS